MPNKYGKNLPVKMRSQSAADARDRADLQQKALGMAKDAASGILEGKVKPPKFKAEGEIEVLGRKPKRNMEGQLRKDIL